MAVPEGRGHHPVLPGGPDGGGDVPGQAGPGHGLRRRRKEPLLLLPGRGEGHRRGDRRPLRAGGQRPGGGAGLRGPVPVRVRLRLRAALSGQLLRHHHHERLHGARLRPRPDPEGGPAPHPARGSHLYQLPALLPPNRGPSQRRDQHALGPSVLYGEHAGKGL